jgi:hypothetical protein
MDRRQNQAEQSADKADTACQAWCLDCGIEDPIEIALAENNYDQVKDDSEMGFHYEFPNVKQTVCPCPNSEQHVPNARRTPT